MTLYNKHINYYIDIIIKITEEFDNFRRRNYKSKNAPYISLLCRNNKSISNELQSYSDIEKLNTLQRNRLYLLLTQEIIFLGDNFHQIENANIFEKLNQYRFIKKHYRGNIINSVSLENLTRHIKKSRADFSIEEPKVLIIVAVPNEFRAIYKKINIIKRVDYLDDSSLNADLAINSIYDLLDETYDKENRNSDIIIDCILTRDNKNVNVIITLLKEYGSFNSSKTTRLLLNKYSNIEEVNLIGVAGQMHATDDVKIGQLIISDKFYNSHTKKLEENDIVYNNKELISSCNQKIGFNFKDWKPSLIEKCPQLNCKTRETNFPKAIEGFFVSGAEVIKSSQVKKNIIGNFYNCSAVEMEFFGCYDACKEFENLPLRTFKAVCDWSDPSKTKEWQPYCADIAAEFTVDYLIDKYGEEI